MMRQVKDEPVQPLSIGSVVGGSTPANAGWREAIRELALRVADVREGTESALNVNIVFQVPGTILQPDHDGIRTGRYSKADRLLMVQVALPEAAPDDAAAYLRAAAMRALDEAEAWAAAHRDGVSLDDLRDVLARV
jgi:hypothetical protein